MLYLDNSASMKPKNLNKVVNEYLQDDLWVNPSSLYRPSKKAKEKIEEVRRLVAKEINAEPCEIFFTSGASESNAWVLNNFQTYDYVGHIITTPIEHKSIDKMGIFADAEKTYCIVLENGKVDTVDLISELTTIRSRGIDFFVLVSTFFANNEIGTINNIKEISEIVHTYKGYLHVDASQAFGHIPIDVKELGIDYMSVSAEKIGGISGCGFLYKNKELNIKPMIYGTQQNGLRGGTENTLGIMMLGEAIKNIDYQKQEKIADVRDYCIEQLKDKFGCVLNGSCKDRLSNNINVTFPQNITGEALIYMLESSGIYISAGSACNSRSNEPSHVLKAIGLSDEDAMKTIRISLNEDITKEDIDFFVSELEKAVRVLEVK